MKNTSNLIKRVAVTTGLLVGGFALAAFAASWTPPTAQPPLENVDAPINVGSSPQTKNGLLGVVSLITRDLRVTTGTPADGLVLTSTNASGDAAWRPVSEDPLLPEADCKFFGSTQSGGSFSSQTSWKSVPVPPGCVNGLCTLYMVVNHYSTPNTAEEIKSTALIQFDHPIKSSGGISQQAWAKIGGSNDGVDPSCSTSGVNGSTTGCDQLIRWGGSSAPFIALMDDNSNAEQNVSSWTIRDNADNHEANFYVCK